MLLKRYPASNRSWTADELWRDLQRERKALRVPFFLYSPAQLGVDWHAQMQQLSQCSSWSRYKHGNDADFLLALADHEWRTLEPAEADLFVVPVAMGAACSYWLSCGYTFADAERVITAVAATDTWRTRKADHLVFGTEPHLLEPATLPGGVTAGACMSDPRVSPLLRWAAGAAAGAAGGFGLVWFERVWGVRNASVVAAPYNDDTLPTRVMRIWARADTPHLAGAHAVNTNRSHHSSLGGLLRDGGGGGMDASLLRDFDEKHSRPAEVDEDAYTLGPRRIDFFFGGRTAVRDTTLRAALVHTLAKAVPNSAFVLSAPARPHNASHADAHVRHRTAHAVNGISASAAHAVNGIGASAAGAVNGVGANGGGAVNGIGASAAGAVNGIGASAVGADAVSAQPSAIALSALSTASHADAHVRHHAAHADAATTAAPTAPTAPTAAIAAIAPTPSTAASRADARMRHHAAAATATATATAPTSAYAHAHAHAHSHAHAAATAPTASTASTTPTSPSSFTASTAASHADAHRRHLAASATATATASAPISAHAHAHAHAHAYAHATTAATAPTAPTSPSSSTVSTSPTSPTSSTSPTASSAAASASASGPPPAPPCPTNGEGELLLAALDREPGQSVPSVQCTLFSSFFHAASVLPHTRFLLCPRGDTPSSNRLVEAFAFGAIPVLVSDRVQQVGLPFQCFVPWSLLSLRWPEKPSGKQQGWEAAARAAQRMQVQSEQRMRRLLWLFRDDMLWHTNRSRVVHNVLLEAARMRRKKAGKHCPFGSEMHYAT